MAKVFLSIQTLPTPATTQHIHVNVGNTNNHLPVLYTKKEPLNHGLHRDFYIKKNSACGGEETPEHWIREDLSCRPRKPPNPCPTLTQVHCNPYRSLCESGPGWAGTYFHVLWRVGKRGDFFLTLAWNSLPPGVEPRPWGVLLRPPNQSG